MSTPKGKNRAGVTVKDLKELVEYLATECGLIVRFELRPPYNGSGLWQLVIRACKLMEAWNDQEAVHVYQATFPGHLMDDMTKRMYWGCWDVWQQYENAQAFTWDGQAVELPPIG